MAKFEKGNKIATGRPAGALNRSTEEMKLTIARATNNVLSTELAFKLLEYVMPKLSRTEMSGEINQKIQQISVNITQKSVDNAS